MNKHILKEYDIRGIIEKDFNAADVYKIGRAFGTTIVRNGARTVCTTYDGRESSLEFASQMNNALKDCGLKVFATGMGTTPMNYFAIHELNVDAGVVITASHNPREYNGIKMSTAKAESFFGEDIQSLISLMDNEDFVDGEGSIEEVKIQSKYVNRLLSDLNITKDLKVVWDNGNGVAGNVLKELIAKLPGEHTILFGEVDGTFPNHHPDPSEHKNLKDLQEKVLELGADLGVAFDGDADRIGVVTNKGEIINNDILVAIFAKEELKKYPNGIVIADVKCSKVLFDKIEEFGGKALMGKTGHVYAKSSLKEQNGLMAGEISGHIIFNRGYYGYDDGIYAAIKIINIVGNTEITLSDLLSEYPKTYVTPEIRIEVPEEEKFAIANKVIDIFKKDAKFEINDIDGIRGTNSDGIVMLRASNTQNLLSVRCESLTDEDGLHRLISIVRENLAEAGVEVALDKFI